MTRSRRLCPGGLDDHPAVALATQQRPSGRRAPAGSRAPSDAVSWKDARRAAADPRPPARRGARGQYSHREERRAPRRATRPVASARGHPPQRRRSTSAMPTRQKPAAGSPPSTRRSRRPALPSRRTGSDRAPGAAARCPITSGSRASHATVFTNRSLLPRYSMKKLLANSALPYTTSRPGRGSLPAGTGTLNSTSAPTVTGPRWSRPATKTPAPVRRTPRSVVDQLSGPVRSKVREPRARDRLGDAVHRPAEREQRRRLERTPRWDASPRS